MNRPLPIVLSQNKARLQQGNYGILYPIFISILYIIVSLSHTLSLINPRAYNHTQVPLLTASVSASLPTQSPFQGIRLAAHPTPTGILIRFSDETQLIWDKSPHTAGMIGAQLAALLKQRLQYLYLKTALAQDVHMEDPVVKIAADNALHYGDLLPILYALAEAGLSQYAFEVQLPEKADSR